LGPEAPSVTYFLPDGTSTAGTTSDDAVWNNGTSTTRGGDVFPNPPVGWWRAEICVAPDNQYIFEPETAFLLEPPLLPDPALSHVCSSSGQSQIIRYTIDFGNTSTDGAAFGPDLTFNLPAGTTFESCSGGLSCSESAPGVVTFALFPVLPAGAATQVTVDVRLGADTPDPLISTAQFEYLDVFSNVYPPLVDTFQAQISECADEPTVVDIDIKPGSDPNSINCNNAEAVITVAILSTDEFDASNVDHATVTFGGASEKHIDKKSGEPRRHEEDVDDDGDADLVFHFRMGDTDLSCDSEDGTLGGETYDGQTIVGTDAVRMVDRGGGNR
jgi:hypothetical protein